MQGTVLFRSLAVAGFALWLSGCHFSTRTTAGVTPEPSSTSLEAASSTAPPQQALSNTPGSKYFAKTGSDVKGVTFSVWANGTPVGSMQWPSKAMDITGKMRGHANVVVIQWQRTTNNGTGTMTIVSQGSKKAILTAHVTPRSSARGQVSKTLIAPQVPVGRPSPGG